MAGRRTAYEARLRGIGDIDVAQMGVQSVMTNAMSGAVVAALQSLNIVIPGLGLVLAFAFKKLFGVVFADSPPDPEAPQFYDIASRMQAAVAAKDYASAMQAFMSKPSSFWWLSYATNGKSNNLFYAAVLGDAMQRHDFSRLEAFGAMIDTLTDNVHFAIESERLAILAQSRGALAEIDRFMQGPSKPGWATTDCYGVRMAEAGGVEAVTINGETGNTLVAINGSMSEGGGG